MEEIDVVGVITGLSGAILTSLIGGWDAGLKILLILMLVDYITGMLLAGVFKKSGNTVCGGLSSFAAWKGLTKKGVTLMMVLVGFQVDQMTGSAFVRDAALIGFSIQELISIIENAGHMGIYIPPVMRKAIDNLNNTNEEEN